MSDHLDRAAEVIAAQMYGLTTPSMCRGIAQALDEAGLLVTPVNVRHITFPCPDCGVEIRVPINVIEDQRLCEPDARIILRPDLTEIAGHDCATAYRMPEGAASDPDVMVPWCEALGLDPERVAVNGFRIRHEGDQHVADFTEHEGIVSRTVGRARSLPVGILPAPCHVHPGTPVVERREGE